MVTSSRIQEKVLDFLSDEKTHSVQEIKSYLADINITNYTEGQFAGSLNTLVRNASIEKMDRGFYAIKKRSENMKKCFVVSPIGNDGTEIRANADKLFKYIIKPVCEDCDFEAIRVDQLNDANSITQTIIEHLESADLVIADITGHNPNVFYEMGYRARTKKPIIHLKPKLEKLPFDIHAIRTFEYDLTDLDSVEEVKERLIKTIKTFTFSSPEETADNRDDSETIQSPVLPILYQILDSITQLQGEVKSINTETIGTVIKTMQSAQPQMSPDAALQAQLLGGFMQNPESFMKLIEISEKLPKSKK
jgi:nucleoside 2-deoxyribosyltransferase